MVLLSAQKERSPHDLTPPLVSSSSEYCDTLIPETFELDLAEEERLASLSVCCAVLLMLWLFLLMIMSLVAYHNPWGHVLYHSILCMGCCNNVSVFSQRSQ